MAKDVLQDHDRAIQDHPNPKGQPPKGHHVDGEPHPLEKKKSGPDGDGYGRSDYQGASEVSEEGKQDYYRQDPPYEGDLFDLLYGFPDEVCRIDKQREGDSFGKLPLESGKDPQHPVGDLNGVASRSFPYSHDHARLTLDPHAPAELLKPIPHISHLLQVDGPALPVGYNNVRYILQARELSQGTDQPLPRTCLETPPSK